MTTLEKEIYKQMPDDMPNVQALDVSRKIANAVFNQNDVDLWLSQALTLIDIAFAQGWNLAVENKIKWSDTAKQKFLSEWGEEIGVIRRGLESIKEKAQEHHLIKESV